MTTSRKFLLLFAIFSIVVLATGIISYGFAARQLKEQLVNKCQALAATVAAIITEDSDEYAAFLENMDMETDYYRRTKALMMKLKQVNEEHVTYIYTEARVGDDTMMYVIGGENPSSPIYTAPGVTDALTKAGRIAYNEQKAVTGEDFSDTAYGLRISAYEPIIHKDTGEFLGLVGADITRTQYNNIMRIFIIQTAAGLIATLMVFGICMRWLSGDVADIINKKQYEADFARSIISSGRGHYQKMNEIYKDLQVMRHDYKFHLNTALDMLRNGEIEKSGEYLRGLQTKLEAKDLPHFCNNTVINSLIADYVQRCKKLDITFYISISLPDGFYIPNYEMCIALGNLLENAVEACLKLETDRRIELVIMPQGAQLALMVRNTFNGKVNEDGNQLISTKKDGGIGLQSVRAVVQRYGESFVTEYDRQWFKAYILWKKDNEE